MPPMAAPAPAPSRPPPKARWPGSYGSVDALSHRFMPSAKAVGTIRRRIVLKSPFRLADAVLMALKWQTTNYRVSARRYDAATPRGSGERDRAAAAFRGLR